MPQVKPGLMRAKKKATTIRITQVRSRIRQSGRQKRTLEALGLRRMHQTVEEPDNPQTRGMIRTVRHLVSIEEPS